jgi:dihydropyrimidine dehydrogenase (NAD+) subunit PreA
VDFDTQGQMLPLAITWEDGRVFSVDRVTDWGNLDLNYDVKAHVNKENCIRCNLCYVACEDGAHQIF